MPRKPKPEPDIREIILREVDRLMNNFFLFDRKDDPELSTDELELALESGIVTKEEIINKILEYFDDY